MSLSLNDTTSSDKLYMAIELSSTEWKLCFGITTGSRKRLRTVEAMDLKVLSDEIKLAKEIFNLTVPALFYLHEVVCPSSTCTGSTTTHSSSAHTVLFKICE